MHKRELKVKFQILNPTNLTLAKLACFIDFSFLFSSPQVSDLFFEGGYRGYMLLEKTNYKRTPPNDQAMADRLDLGPGSKVLDVGCGRGLVAHHMASYSGAHVTGINIDHSQVKMAKESLARKVEDEFFCFCLFVFLNFCVFFFGLGWG